MEGGAAAFGHYVKNWIARDLQPATCEHLASPSNASQPLSERKRPAALTCPAVFYRITATANDRRPSAALKMSVMWPPFLFGQAQPQCPDLPDLG
jgi:hypothetical protein